MGGDAQDVYGPGLDLHHEQDVQALEKRGVDVQEIAGQDAGRLTGQELPPGRRRPPRSRSEADGGQDPLSALEPVSTTVAVLNVGSLSRSLLGEARRRA